MFVNHYEILGVSEDADPTQITAAWKRLLIKYHPDLNHEDSQAVKQAVLINKAYEILSNSAKRSRFDRKLEEFKKGNHDGAMSRQVIIVPQADDDGPGFSDNSDPINSQDSGSLADNSRDRSRQHRYTTLMTLIGIVMGAVTAIPLGWLVVWSISGHDPLGIFGDSQEFTAQKRDIDSPDQNENELVDSVAKGVSPSQSPGALKDFSAADPSAPEQEAQPSESGGQRREEESDVAGQSPNAGKKIDNRIAIPAADDYEAARKDIWALYQRRFDEANSESGIDRLVLLKGLADQVFASLATAKDVVNQYAIQKVSIDLAKQSCFTLETLQWVEQFEKQFKVDGVEFRIELLGYWNEQLPKVIEDTGARQSSFHDLAKVTKPLTEKVIDRKNWNQALLLSELLREFYVASGDVESATTIEKSISGIKQNCEDEENILAFCEDLKLDPDQPVKQQAVGSYYCFVMDDWNKGLPFLHRASHPGLAQCAKEDANASSESRKKVGDLWWALADDPNFQRYQKAIQARAAHHYSKALVATEGDQRAILDKRIQDATPVPRISIVKASFGHNRKWTDATEAIRKILNRDPPVFTNSANGMGVRDPIPRIKKKTVINYVIRGEKKSVTLRAGPNLKYNLHQVLK